MATFTAYVQHISPITEDYDAIDSATLSIAPGGRVIITIPDFDPENDQLPKVGSEASGWSQLDPDAE